MQTARLLMLADLLDTISPERFNLNRWVGEDWLGRDDLSCGTTACALGWATTIPEFKAYGLKLKTRIIDESDLTSRLNTKFAYVALDNHALGIANPQNNEDSLRNAEIFFGLSRAEAEQIFWPDTYREYKRIFGEVKPWEVARRIRVMVSEYLD